ncbi:NAD-dependent epimerase/dehydratase [Pseudomonas sp. MAFF212428]|uniref:NAD-dependent epimerase/dehydratase n=1 Tax=Pseudomonas brassicae TaxID=2708063 RepID=A0A6B3NVH6_9PSED|nr:NAD(P)-dependent oxidoreductase [Pseudomonas brassicae]NER59355.1 NAD-dependent epimerase/dehydratase [Pseudomonas brassicae]NER65803.1 NAD-dependent epimerase/dehydratase [Pseudomonas brassicae]
MKILIVGGQSSLGQSLLAVLQPFADVVTAGRSGCDMSLDLTWPVEQLQLPQGIDVVINTAAHFGVGDIDSIVEAEQVNALGTLKLCHAAHLAGVGHFVNISSISALLQPDSEFYGIYALSKRHADEVVQLHCARANLPCTVLRPSQLYGHDSFRKHQVFLYNAVDQALRGEDVIIYGSRDARRNYLYAEDFCQLVAAVIRQRVEGTYSCTSAQDSSLVAVANAAIKAAGSASNVRFNDAFKDMADNVFPYDDTLYRKTGVYPVTGIEEGLARVIENRLIGS